MSVSSACLIRSQNRLEIRLGNPSSASCSCWMPCTISRYGRLLQTRNALDMVFSLLLADAKAISKRLVVGLRDCCNVGWRTLQETPGLLECACFLCTVVDSLLDVGCDEITARLDFFEIRLQRSLFLAGCVPFFALHLELLSLQCQLFLESAQRCHCRFLKLPE